MTTARSLFMILFITASLSSHVAWAGEPNPDAFTSGSKSEKSKPMPGRDCGPEVAQDVSAPDAAILLE